MFRVNAGVKEKNSFMCLGGPVQPGLCCGACLALSLVAGVGALQNCLHGRECLGLKSSWELVFLQAIGRIGEPIDLRQRKNKLTLPKGAVQLLA